MVRSMGRKVPWSWGKDLDSPVKDLQLRDLKEGWAVLP